MVFQTCALFRSALRNTNKTTKFIYQNRLKCQQFCTAATITNSHRIPVTNISKKFDKCDTFGSGGYDDQAFYECQNKSISPDNDSRNFEAHNQISNVISVATNNCELDALVDIPEDTPGPLNRCTEDLSHVGPYFQPTYTIAKYANESNTLQQLVKLGVELYKIERHRDVMEMFLKSDFDKDLKPHIRFLHDCGVPSDRLGKFISKNPRIFMESVDNLAVRIRYLRAHNFEIAMVQKIVSRNPLWLSFTTKQIDKRLGHFQHTFKLTGSETRFIAVKAPMLITWKMQSIRESTFAVEQEMGFNVHEKKLVLFRAPRVWRLNRDKVVNSFDYAHNKMQLSHEAISKQPKILTCRKSRLEQRHRFLVELKRAQYDPAKPMYVSPDALINGDDVEFCRNVAKSTVHVYNMFLKSF